MSRRTLAHRHAASAVLLLSLIALLLTTSVAHASYPGRNGKIAFTFSDPGFFRATTVNTINPDGTDRGELSSLGGAYEPAWSPDGSKLAFAQFDLLDAPIQVVDRDGHLLATLFGPGFQGQPERGYAYSPTWSPDGTQVVYYWFDASGLVTSGIYESSLAGPPRLLFARSFALLSWSPDGSKIALNSGGTLSVMNADGSGNVTLTGQAECRCAFGNAPDWSPDSKRLAFTSDRAGQNDVYVIDVATGHEERLTSSPASDFDPTWSPDRHRIAFISNRGGQPELYVMHAHGQDQRRLTFGEGSQASLTNTTWQSRQAEPGGSGLGGLEARGQPVHPLKPESVLR
jgi:Tol biopolymer transport system component